MNAYKFLAAIITGLMVGMLFCWFAQPAEAQAATPLRSTAVRVWDGNGAMYSADFKIRKGTSCKVYVRSHGKWQRTYKTRGGYRRGRLVVCCLKTTKTYRFVFRTADGKKRYIVLRGGC